MSNLLSDHESRVNRTLMQIQLHSLFLRTADIGFQGWICAGFVSADRCAFYLSSRGLREHGTLLSVNTCLRLCWQLF